MQRQQQQQNQRLSDSLLCQQAMIMLYVLACILRAEERSELSMWKRGRREMDRKRRIQENLLLFWFYALACSNCSNNSADDFLDLHYSLC